jgi:hypothetical protein
LPVGYEKRSLPLTHPHITVTFFGDGYYNYNNNNVPKFFQVLKHSCASQDTDVIERKKNKRRKEKNEKEKREKRK